MVANVPDKVSYCRKPQEIKVWIVDLHDRNKSNQMCAELHQTLEDTKAKLCGDGKDR